MRVVLTLLIGMLSFNALADKCKEYDDLSATQKNRLEFSYHQGEVLNFGYTISAISLVESSAGLYRLNMKSGDVGLYMINTKNIYNILGITNYYKKLQIVERVMYDDILGSYLALHVLDYFYKYHRGDWRKAVSSYNAGFNVAKGEGYMLKVVDKVKMLKKCMDIT